MENIICKVYQGEDIDITIKARNSECESVDISEMLLDIAFINNSTNKIVLSSSKNSIYFDFADDYTINVSLQSEFTKSLSVGDYTLSFILSYNDKSIIEQVKIFRVLSSIHGREYYGE